MPKRGLKLKKKNVYETTLSIKAKFKFKILNLILNIYRKGDPVYT